MRIDNGRHLRIHNDRQVFPKVTNQINMGYNYKIWTIQ